ncbi:MAG: DUF362 domain-containing protein [Clostridiales bacterium]|jgi:uncharacterized protein (DUF362 family)|nr:DUF362 domain-containing protein [Clostridiales bacterium]
MIISYGAEIEKITYETLKASDIGEYLRADFSVAIKPNLVVPKPASDGATTHPEVVEGIVRFLKDFRVKNISIIESSAIGHDTKRAFSECGYEPLKNKFGVELIDLKFDACKKIDYKGMKLEICRRALETDFLINVPVLKAHCQTNLTCNLKNLKGCIPDGEKRRYHSMGLHKPIAALSAIIKTGYCVVDGICGDLTFEEGGNPTYANRIIAGRDPVLIDSYCAELIGYRPNEIDYLVLANKWGAGEFYSPETKMKELFADKKPMHPIKSNRIAARYEQSITHIDACSACYAALIHAMHRMGGSPDRFFVGHGFSETHKQTCTGIGDCTRDMPKHVPGCPPTATDIINFFERNK